MKRFWMLMGVTGLILGASTSLIYAQKAGTLEMTEIPPQLQNLVNTVNAISPQTMSDTFIIPGERFGAISATSTLADLQRLYGPANVVDGELYIAEGMCEAGTKLFPGQPDKTLFITWGDRRHKAFPLIVQMLGDHSLWRTPEGITLGTPVGTLMGLNRTPFKFSGLGWDYGGYINSWENGELDRKLGDAINIRLGYSPTMPESIDVEKISGEGVFSSTALKPYAQHIVVERIDYTFLENTKKFPDHGQFQQECTPEP
jgi:hypothetical protein